MKNRYNFNPSFVWHLFLAVHLALFSSCDQSPKPILSPENLKKAPHLFTPLGLADGPFLSTPRPFSEGYIAKELLPEEFQKNWTLHLTQPKFHDWQAWDDYPSRAKGPGSQGLFTKAGLERSFSRICGQEIPSFLSPVSGDVLCSNFTSGAMQIRVSCHYKCPLDKIADLAAAVEKTWREKYPRWLLTKNAPTASGRENDFGWSPQSVWMELDNDVKGKQVGVKKLNFHYDPISGFIKISHWEGDLD